MGVSQKLSHLPSTHPRPPALWCVYTLRFVLSRCFLLFFYKVLKSPVTKRRLLNPFRPSKVSPTGNFNRTLTYSEGFTRPRPFHQPLGPSRVLVPARTRSLECRPVSLRWVERVPSMSILYGERCHQI